MTKSTEQIISLLGTLYANAIFVPILPSLKHDNISHIVNDSGMKVIITDDRRLSEISSFQNLVTVVIGRGDLTSNYPNLPYLSNHLGNQIPKFSRIGVDIAAIIYSSGSTGRPKGIMVTHRNFADGARIVSQYLGITQEDKIACILSFNFDYGINQIFQSLLTGASLHLHELVMPNDCIHFLSKSDVTVVPLMPVILTRLFDSRFLDHNQTKDLLKVRCVCSSGGRISQDMLANVHNFFPSADFYSMYGLTEAFRSTYLPPKYLAQRPNSIGIAIPDVEILVLDEQGNECLPNQVGELVHRGGCITKGYWNNPAQTAERFRAHPKYPGELLVYSGDLAVKDKEGFITFVNRKDGMLKNNGIRISPTEIEEVMERELLVQSVVVFGIENIQVGHDIVACYTSTNGQLISEGILRQFLKSNLPTHMIPKYLLYFDTFPSTGNQGKIDRVAVQNQALSILGKN